MNENLDVFVPSTPSSVQFQSAAGLLSQSLILQQSLSSSPISTSPVTMATTKTPITSTTEMNFINSGGSGSTKGFSGHPDYARTTLEFFSSFAGGDGSGSISTKRDTTPTTIRPLLVPTLPELRHRITHARPYLSKHHHEHHWGPFFEEPLNVTNGALPVGVHLGAETYLNCRVGMLRDKTVIWIRRTAEKVSLLTVGNVTYSGDPRVSVNFQYPNNWRLHINPVQRDDGGLYMCQVSTHPPRVFATNVTVLSAAIRVVDEHGHEVQDRYYKIGSLIDLTCEVAVSFLSLFPLVVPGTHPYLPSSGANRDSASTAANTHTHLLSKLDYYHQKIVWRKDNGSIPKDGYLNLSSTSQWRISRLTIPHADRSHSGIYSCSLLNSSTAVVHVQILNGEQPAAVQTGSSTIMNSKNSLLNLVLLLLIFKILDISC